MRLIIYQVAIYSRAEGMQAGRTWPPAGFLESSPGLVKTLPSHQLSTLHLAASWSQLPPGQTSLTSQSLEVPTLEAWMGVGGGRRHLLQENYQRIQKGQQNQKALHENAIPKYNGLSPRANLLQEGRPACCVTDSIPFCKGKKNPKKEKPICSLPPKKGSTKPLP